MSEQVYGERRRRRDAERAEQESALREVQAAQERAGGTPETTQSRRELRSSSPSASDGPALEVGAAPRGSRHETSSSVSHTLAPVSPIQPVSHFTRSAVHAGPATPRDPSATSPSATSPSATSPSATSRPQSPAVSRAPFHPPTQGPGQQGYPTAAIPTAAVPSAKSPAQPPTVVRPGSALGAFGSSPVEGSRGRPPAPAHRSAMPAVKPHAGPWTPGAQPSSSRVPSDRTSALEAAPWGYPVVAAASAAGSPALVAPDSRGIVGQPQAWGDVIHGSPLAYPPTPPTSTVGQPQAPPLSVFASQTTPGPRPTTLADEFGASMAAGQVTPPPIPTSGIVIPTVLGQSPTSGARSAAAAAPTWSAKVDTGPPTGSPLLGGGTYVSTAVEDRPEAPFADQELPSHSYIWIQFLVLLLVAFVLGLLIYLLINSGSSAVASAAASAQFFPALIGLGRRWSPDRSTRHRPRHRGEL